MDLSLLPPLYLIYVANPSDSGKVSVMECLNLCYYGMNSACTLYSSAITSNLHVLFLANMLRYISLAYINFQLLIPEIRDVSGNICSEDKKSPLICFI